MLTKSFLTHIPSHSGTHGRAGLTVPPSADTGTFLPNKLWSRVAASNSMLSVNSNGENNQPLDDVRMPPKRHRHPPPPPAAPAMRQTRQRQGLLNEKPVLQALQEVDGEQLLALPRQRKHRHRSLGLKHHRLLRVLLKLRRQVQPLTRP